MLDRLRPYAEVHGLPGAVYEQDGKYFRPDGAEATPSPIEDTAKQEAIEQPHIFVVEHQSPPSFTEEPNQNFDDTNGRNIETMHWKHVKALVETFGGEWTNKNEAIKFLKGKK